MKKLLLIPALTLSISAFALPEDFSFKGDVKIAGKHFTKHGGKADKQKEEEERKAGLPISPPPVKWWNEDKANVEATLMANVKQDAGWAAAKVKIANNVGTLKASDSVLVQKVLVGSDFYESGATRWYGELGRQQLSDHFESAVQFNHILDGIYSECSRPVGRFGTFTAQGGPMVVDLEDKAKAHFGWVAMIGFDGIAGTGAYAKVSMTRWDADTQPIQLLAGYRFGKLAFIPSGRAYIAYLINPTAMKVYHKNAAGKERIDHYQHAAYIGAQCGNIQKRGDWAVKMELRAVQAQSLYENDATGINFWGPVTEVKYAFTDNFSASLKLQHSSRLNHLMDGDRSNSLVEGKVVLAF